MLTQHLDATVNCGDRLVHCAHANAVGSKHSQNPQLRLRFEARTDQLRRVKLDEK